MAHLAKILMSRGETCAAEMGASDRVAREPATVSAEMMVPAAVSAKAMSAAMAMTAAMPVPAAVTSSVAAASGDRVARQRQHEGKNRNSYHAQ
jgi:hypothetical protein